MALKSQPYVSGKPYKHILKVCETLALLQDCFFALILTASYVNTNSGVPLIHALYWCCQAMLILLSQTGE